MMMDALSVRAEEACLQDWPALKEIFYDGWLIRLAEGQTRRTNSVNVIGAGRYALDEKIVYCERVYRAHGLPAHFRIRSIDDPALAQPSPAGLRAHEKYSGQPAAKNDIRKRLLDLVALPVAFACVCDARGLI